MLGLPPGKSSRPRNLDVMLQQNHDGLRARVREDAEHRAKVGAEASEDEWEGEAQAALERALGHAAAGRRDDARAAAALALSVLTEPLKDIGERTPDPELATVWVRFRGITQEQYLRMTQAMAAAGRTTGSGDDDEESQMEAIIARMDAMEDFLQVAISEVIGLEDDEGEPVQVGGDDGLDEADLDTLDAYGLVPSLFACARTFHDLGPREKKAYGSQAPSTSGSSDATSAPRSSDVSEGARAAGAGSPAPDTRTTPAPEGTCSGSRGSTMCTSSGTPPTGASASTG